MLFIFLGGFSEYNSEGVKGGAFMAPPESPKDVVPLILIRYHVVRIKYTCKLPYYFNI